MKWSDIPQRIRDGAHTVDYEWRDLLGALERYETNYGLVLCPDFQRGHVWTTKQRVAYVESKLSGGIGIDIIRLNHPGWMTTFEGSFVCVDGLQRLTTAMLFLRDELPVFNGYVYREIIGHMPATVKFTFAINNLQTPADVLRWYLELNGGGTPHSPEELARVKQMLHALRA